MNITTIHLLLVMVAVACGCARSEKLGRVAQCGEFVDKGREARLLVLDDGSGIYAVVEKDSAVHFRKGQTVRVVQRDAAGAMKRWPQDVVLLDSDIRVSDPSTVQLCQ